MSRAVVFSGQGAQFIGMGKDLAETHEECKALFDKADEVLGYSLSGICFDGPEEELTKTSICQPAIFVASIACWTALKKVCPGLEISTAAGLSLGEWSALHMAGALSFEDTLKVLEARGRFMQEACDTVESGMVSIIGLDAAQIETICDETGVQISNLNSGVQMVLAGAKEDVAKAEAAAKAAGAKRAVVLNVAGAYHSKLMDPAAEKLAEVLADVTFADLQIPVVSNVTGKTHGGSDEIRENMIKQVNSTVNWVGGIDFMKSSGVDSYVECGPGKVVSGLIKRIDKEASLLNVQDIASLEKAAAELGA